MLLNKKVKVKKYQISKCTYPGCEEKILSNGLAIRFCKEHKKAKYRKKKEEKKENENQKIKHSNNTSVKIISKCQLDGCNNEFEIILLPRVYTYPKYCPEHRNEYKRKLFLKNH